MINENSSFMPIEKIEEHVRRLNKGGLQSLATEWEIAVLNTLSRVGHIEHEKPFGGSSYPDIFFQERNKKFSFVADIATVSDAGYEEENPIDDFIEETLRILKKEGIKLGGFYYKIGSLETQKGVKLKLPPKRKFNDFFKRPDFVNFVEGIKDAPEIPRVFRVISDEVEVIFSHDPKGEYISGNYLQYKVAHRPPYKIHPDKPIIFREYNLKNPVYNALKGKSIQLKKSGFDGIMGVCLCDGGCELLTRSWQDHRSHRYDEIIFEFLRQNSSISFVMIFSVKTSTGYGYGIPEKKLVDVKIFPNSADSAFIIGLEKLGQHLLKNMPVPANTLINAFHRVKNGFEKRGLTFYGGGEIMKNSSIKISSVGLIDLLSGNISQAQFLKDHDFVPEFFNRKANERRMIKNIRVEKNPDQDDDWIVFEFDDPDPAIGRYRVPDKKTGLKEK